MTPSSGMRDSGDVVSTTLSEAFANETRRGALLAIVICALWSAALTVNAFVTAFYNSRFPGFFHMPVENIIEGCLSLLVPIPIYLVAARSRQPLAWCVLSMAFDILIWLQGLFFWFSEPSVVKGLPLFIYVREGDIASFIILLSIYALPLSRNFISWGGAAVAAVWTAGIVRAFLDFKGASLYWGPFGPGMGDNGLRAMMNPGALVPDYFVIQLALVAVFTGFLVMSIQRGRNYVGLSVAAHADMGVLRRFFPPVVAARVLDGPGDRLAPVRRHVAVLFVQAPNFDAGPRLDELQRFFAGIETVVFAHDGIVDRFTGGPIMATFGALDDDGKAADRALACALAILRGSALAFSSMSLHAGSTVCGDVGGTHSRVFSVVGDTVNVARRILDVEDSPDRLVLASEEFVGALSDDGRAAAHFTFKGAHSLRGREAPVRIWKVGP